MKNLKIVLHMVLILSIFSCIILFSKEKDTLNVNSRIEMLEKNEENVKLLYDSRSEQMKLDYSKHKADLEEEVSFNKYLLFVFGGFSVVGLLVGWFAVYRFAIKYANKKIVDTFDNHIQAEKDKIVSFIKSLDEERSLKAESKILVLSPKESNEDFLRLFFSVNEFSHVDYHKPDDNFSLKKYNMVFLNNEESSFTPEQVQHLRPQSNQVYFIFGKDKVNLSENMNCANSRITLYNNVINTLRYLNVLRAN